MTAPSEQHIAGIVVPKSIIDNATKYLEKCTTPRGGVIYSLAHGGMAMAGSVAPFSQPSR